MSVEKKTVRSDIPGSHVFLNNNIGYVGSTADEARRLVVGRDISLQGQISACAYLVVEGVFQSDMFTSRRLDILEGGLFSGIAEVQDCVIAGRFEGKLSVRGRLTVKSTGQLCGDISYGTIEAEAGAKIEGQMVFIAPPAAEAVVPKILPDNVEKLFVEEGSEDADDKKTFKGRGGNYRRAARY